MTGRNRDSTDYGHSNKLTRYFDDFLNDVGLTRNHGSIRRMGPGEDRHSTWSPAIDITENDREYVVFADVPGVRKEDLDVEFHHSMLVISGQNHQDPHTTAQLAQEIGVGKDRQHQINEPQPQDYQPQQYSQYPNQQPQVSTQPNQSQQYSQYPNQQPQVNTQPNQPTQVNTQPNQPTQMTQPNQPTQTTQPNQTTQTTQPNQTTQTTQPTQTTQTDQPIKTNHPPEEQPYEYQHIKHRQRNKENKDNRDNRDNRENNNSSRIHVQERPYGYFSRSIQLPNDIKAEANFQASLENGVLKIWVPKNSDRPRRKITVN